MDRDRPSTIVEDEISGFENRENHRPKTGSKTGSNRTKIELRETPNKETPNR